VENIVSNHLGTVSVWSAVGSGSTFTIRLPRVHSDRPSSEPLATEPTREDPAPVEGSLT
jgi:two-component system sensor histidine kinase SenX3